MSREDLEIRLDEAEALIHKFGGVFRFYEQQHVNKYHNQEATVEQKTATRKKASRNALLASEAENFLAVGPIEPIPDV